MASISYTQTETYSLTWASASISDDGPPATDVTQSYLAAITGTVGVYPFTTTVPNPGGDPDSTVFGTTFSITDPSSQFTTPGDGSSTSPLPTLTTTSVAPTSTTTSLANLTSSALMTSSSASSTHTSTASDLSSNSKLGVGVGVGLGIPLITIGILAAWWIHRRRLSSNAAMQDDTPVKTERASPAPLYQVD